MFAAFGSTALHAVTALAVDASITTMPLAPTVGRSNISELRVLDDGSTVASVHWGALEYRNVGFVGVVKLDEDGNELWRWGTGGCAGGTVEGYDRQFWSTREIEYLPLAVAPTGEVAIGIRGCRSWELVLLDADGTELWRTDADPELWFVGFAGNRVYFGGYMSQYDGERYLMGRIHVHAMDGSELGTYTPAPIADDDLFTPMVAWALAREDGSMLVYEVAIGCCNRIVSVDADMHVRWTQDFASVGGAVFQGSWFDRVAGDGWAIAGRRSGAEAAMMVFRTAEDGSARWATPINVPGATWSSAHTLLPTAGGHVALGSATLEEGSWCLVEAWVAEDGHAANPTCTPYGTLQTLSWIRRYTADGAIRLFGHGLDTSGAQQAFFIDKQGTDPATALMLPLPFDTDWLARAAAVTPAGAAMAFQSPDWYDDEYPYWMGARRLINYAPSGSQRYVVDAPAPAPFQRVFASTPLDDGDMVVVSQISLQDAQDGPPYLRISRLSEVGGVLWSHQLSPGSYGCGDPTRVTTDATGRLHVLYRVQDSGGADCVPVIERRDPATGMVTGAVDIPSDVPLNDWRLAMHVNDDGSGAVVAGGNWCDYLSFDSMGQVTARLALANGWYPMLAPLDDGSFVAGCGNAFARISESVATPTDACPHQVRALYALGGTAWIGAGTVHFGLENADELALCRYDATELQAAPVDDTGHRYHEGIVVLPAAEGRVIILASRWIARQDWLDFVSYDPIGDVLELPLTLPLHGHGIGSACWHAAPAAPGRYAVLDCHDYSKVMMVDAAGRTVWTYLFEPGDVFSTLSSVHVGADGRPVLAGSTTTQFGGPDTAVVWLGADQLFGSGFERIW